MTEPSSAPADLEVAMGLYASGDDAALASVYDLGAPALYGFLLRLCRQRSLAEDLVHETFLRVHGARGTYRRGASVRPWMFAIGRRLFLDHLRSHRRDGPSLDADDADPGIVGIAAGPAADEALVGSRLEAMIEAHLRKMPESQATAFRLLKQEHLSIAEAAAVLGTTEMTVKLRAHRAYEFLRESLGRDWDLSGTSAA